MTERQARIAYQSAYKAWEKHPDYTKAVAVVKAAQALVDISDDYQSARDEADDIMAEYA